MLARLRARLIKWRNLKGGFACRCMFTIAHFEGPARTAPKMPSSPPPHAATTQIATRRRHWPLRAPHAPLLRQHVATPRTATRHGCCPRKRASCTERSSHTILPPWVVRLAWRGARRVGGSGRGDASRWLRTTGSPKSRIDSLQVPLTHVRPISCTRAHIRWRARVHAPDRCAHPFGGADTCDGVCANSMHVMTGTGM